MNNGKKKVRGSSLDPSPHLESSSCEFCPISRSISESSPPDEIQDELEVLKV